MGPTALDSPQHLVLLGASRVLGAHALTVSAREVTDTQPWLAPGRQRMDVLRPLR